MLQIDHQNDNAVRGSAVLCMVTISAVQELEPQDKCL